MRTATPVPMWAIVIRNPRCDWIYYPSVDRTRSGAWKKYGDGLGPGVVEKATRKGQCRAVRVTVAVT